MNRILLSGRLTRDAEVNETKGGNTVVEMRIAVNITAEKALFIDVSAWNSIASNIAGYLTKGTKIIVDGMLNVNEYENKYGENVAKYYVTASFVELCEKKLIGSNVPDVQAETTERVRPRATEKGR